MLTNHYKMYDLTHLLNSSVPTWGGSCDFNLSDLTTVEKDGFCVQSVDLIKSGVGTHIDSPKHFCDAGIAVDELTLESLFCPAHIIDVSKRATQDYKISVDDISQYEKKFGRIQKSSIVVFHTGWAQYWHDPDTYRGIDAEGKMHFPTIELTAAEYLLEKNINGIGIDTLSPEVQCDDFPIHHLLLGNGKYILENLTNCHLLPALGTTIIALPIKIEGAAEAPTRVIGLVPR